MIGNEKVQITVWTARAALHLFEKNLEFGGSLSGMSEIRDALARLDREKAAKAAAKKARGPKRAVKLARARKAVKRATKRDRTAEVRRAVVKRADGKCECGCGMPLVEGHFLADPHMDHFFGRARSESVETCWALRADCDLAKTRNAPSKSAWLEKFISHCERHRYLAAELKARKDLETELLMEQAEAAGKAVRP